MKYYVVADIHGYYSKLKSALKRKGFFEDTAPHKLVICGDIFDRGSETIEIQNFIKDLLNKDEVILIRGNHEDLMEDLVKDLSEGKIYMLGGYNRSNGTTWSLLDLTHCDLIDARTKTNEIVSRYYETVYYREILPKMLNYYETKNYIFVHGWIPCLELIEKSDSVQYLYQEDWRDANEERWNRSRWVNGMYAASIGVIEPNKTVVCGHWHASYGHSILDGKCSEFGKDANFSPYYAKGIIAIDACTAHSGKINCIVIEDDESVEFVGRKILKEHKKVFEELAKNE